VAFREYKIGARLFGVALGGSMMITLYFPSLDITSIAATEQGLRKGLSYGRIAGFSIEDPLNKGWHKPLTVVLNKDPRTGEPMDETYAYVYPAGTPFVSSIRHPRIMGKGVMDLSLEQGHIGEAKESQGAVFLVSEGRWEGKKIPYIENATVTRNWTPSMVLQSVTDKDIHHVAAGKSMFVREGCWWCHTLLPEQTQDWQAFGEPPRLGDFNSESPTAFGSDRKAPDLTHVGSRNSSREWMTMHFFNPRLVQPHSIMPRFDYLWGDKDAEGNAIDFDKWRAEYNEYVSGQRIYPPEVPDPAPNSEARYLIDFVLSLK
jgi:cytochrome c oxidase cbb3-type subunit 2